LMHNEVVKSDLHSTDTGAKGLVVDELPPGCAQAHVGHLGRPSRRPQWVQALLRNRVVA
jgi:hypothetical protein